MDPFPQLVGQDIVDHSVTLHPACALEQRRDDRDTEVCLALGPGAHMAGMQMGLVDDIEGHGLERGFELAAHCFCDCHVWTFLSRALGSGIRSCYTPTEQMGTSMPRANPDSFLESFAPREPGVRMCDRPGCTEEGTHRAPKSRDRLNDYYWFCLEHVREYNKAWNYYDGMSDNEVEEDIRRSTTWNRPSWPFGTMKPGQGPRRRVNDPFGFMDDDEEGGETRRRQPADTAEGKAAAVLGLEPPFTLERLKARYKELVKKHHPDANGGDKAAEERLKSINEAYTTLRRFLS